MLIYLSSKNTYYVDSESTNLSTKTNDIVLNIEKNIYGNRSFLNTENVIKYYSDDTFANEESADNIGAF